MAKHLAKHGCVSAYPGEGEAKAAARSHASASFAPLVNPEEAVMAEDNDLRDADGDIDPSMLMAQVYMETSKKALSMTGDGGENGSSSASPAPAAGSSGEGPLAFLGLSKKASESEDLQTPPVEPDKEPNFTGGEDGQSMPSSNPENQPQETASKEIEDTKEESLNEEKVQEEAVEEKGSSENPELPDHAHLSSNLEKTETKLDHEKMQQDKEEGEQQQQKVEEVIETESGKEEREQQQPKVEEAVDSEPGKEEGEQQQNLEEVIESQGENPMDTA